jgi:hypothetical protein
MRNTISELTLTIYIKLNEIISDLPLDIKDSLETVRGHSKKSTLALDNLQMRLIKAKSILHEIKQLKSSPNYLSFEEIRQKEISVEAKIVKSNKIKLQIEKLEADPALLSEETQDFYEDMSDQFATLERKNLVSIFDQNEPISHWSTGASY